MKRDRTAIFIAGLFMTFPAIFVLVGISGLRDALDSSGPVRGPLLMVGFGLLVITTIVMGMRYARRNSVEDPLTPDRLGDEADHRRIAKSFSRISQPPGSL